MNSKSLGKERVITESWFKGQRKVMWVEKVLGDGFSELQKGLWRLLGKRGKWRNCGSGEEEITDAQLAWRGHRLPAQELALFRYLILVRFIDRVERD